MAGILGIVRQVEPALAIQDLRRGVARFGRPGNPRIRVSSDGRAAFADFGQWNAADADGPVRADDILVVVEGRLHREQMTGVVSQLVADIGVDDVGLIRALYLALGSRAFAMLRGVYAAVVYDSRDGSLHLASDVVGHVPLAYAATDAMTSFGSVQWAVLEMSGLPVCANDEALAELLLGYPTGAIDRNIGLLAGVDALGPGQLVTVRDGKRTRQRVRDFELSPHGERTYDSLREEFRFLLRQAVARCLDPVRPTVIGVSGGLDSSAIFSLAKGLESEGVPTAGIVGFNYPGYPGGLGDERVYVDALERRFSTRMVPISLVPDGFLDSLPESVHQSETPLAFLPGNLLRRQYAAAAELGASSFVTGSWSDEAFEPRNYWFHLLWSGRIAGCWRAIVDHHGWITESTETPLESFASVLRESVGFFTPLALRRGARRLWPRKRVHPLETGRLGRYSTAKGARPATREDVRLAAWQRDLLTFPRVWHGLQGGYREAACFGLRRGLPFMDPDLLQFMLRCDGTQLNPGGRFKGLLRDALAGDVPAEILGRHDKGDFSKEFVPPSARDSRRGLERHGGYLHHRGYLNGDLASHLAGLAAGLTRKRAEYHTAWQYADCAALASWLLTTTGGSAVQNMQREEGDSSRKASYQSPKIIRHGSVAELTRQSPGSNTGKNNGNPDPNGTFKR